MDNAVVYPKFRHFVGIAASVAWINIGWVIVGFAPLIPFISAEFDVPVGAIVVAVMAVEALAGGTSALLCGPLVDRFGPRKVLFVSALLSVLYAVLIPFYSHNLLQLVLLRILVGLGTHGPIFASKAALAQRWFPRSEQGTWIGIWNATFAVGTGVMYQVYFPLMQYFISLQDNPVRWLPSVPVGGEWRLVGAFLAVVSALFAVLMGITLAGKEAPVARHGAGHDIAKRDLKIAFKLSSFWAAAILLGCAQGIMQSVNGITASYLMRGLNWFPQIAGPCMVFIQGGMIVSGFLMGAMLTYLFRGKAKWLAALGYLTAGIAAFCLVTPFAKGGTAHMKICFFCVGFLMNIGYPAVTTFITANFPPYILGKVFGICGGISVYMGAIASAVAGVLLDKTHTYTSVYAFIFSVGIVAFVIAAIFLNPVKAYAGRGQQGGPTAGGPPTGAPTAVAQAK